MKHSTKHISICVSLFLALTFNPIAGAKAPPLDQPNQDGFTLSDNALAAAKRFRNNPTGRTFADLEVVLNEMMKVSGAKVEYLPIPQQQLIDLLGPPSTEDQNAQVTYGHSYFGSYGTTSFFFEGGKLKNFLTIGEPSIRYASTIRPSRARLLWYKVVRWSGKLKSLF